MVAVTGELIRFVQQATFSSLPSEMVHVTRRGLVDAIGCALAGSRADRGTIAVKLAKRLGGPPESSVIGVAGKLSCVHAAFANGELVNALDFDATPHAPPNVIPPLLAVAEMKRLPGSALIAAITAAHEVAWRLNAALSAYNASYIEKGTSPDVFGNSNESVLGAALGVGTLLGLDASRLANALGIAAYCCSLPVGKDWHEVRPPKPMIKYAPNGWLCNAAVMAGLQAEQGCTGNPAVLDGAYGFPRFYGAGRWDSESVLRDLGSHWVSAHFQFKPYACCRFFHSQLDCFIDLIEEQDLQPDEIVAVESLGMPFAANADPMSVTTPSDAQFSLPFNLAAAAYRIPTGPDWQDASVLRDPRLHAFMKKVTIGVDPRAQAAKQQDRRAWAARVTVSARDRSYVRETLHARGTPIAGFEMTDEQLSRKFSDAARASLSRAKIDRALDDLWHLDQCPDVSRLLQTLTP